MSNLRAYLTMEAEFLKQHGQQRSLAGFLLERGRAFTADEKTFLGRRMTAKQCFYNAAKVASRNHAMTYVEGYVQTIIPIQHAWLMRPDGGIFDPTLRPFHVPPPYEYFGVAFSTEYLTRTVIANRVSGLLDACTNPSLIDVIEGSIADALHVRP